MRRFRQFALGAVPSGNGRSEGAARWQILFVIGAVALCAAWAYRGTGNKAILGGGNVKAVIHLEPFVINLQDPNQKAYLRIGIDVGIGRIPASSGATTEDVPLLRDAIIQVLARCGPDDLLTSEGKEKLKAAVVQALQRRAPELNVQEVYFTDFLIQR